MSFVLNTVHTCMYYMYRSSVEHFAIASAGFLDLLACFAVQRKE